MRIEAVQPARFDRAQVILRVVIALVTGYAGVSFGWLLGVLYLALPVVAAVVISARGSERYLTETAPSVARMLAWLLKFYAYMMLLTDRFPLDGDARSDLESNGEVRVQIEAAGHPTVTTALARLVMGLPLAVLVFLLGVVGGLVWIVSALLVLVNETVPPPLFNYQLFLLRMQGALYVYIASLADEIPSISGAADPPAPPAEDV